MMAPFHFFLFFFFFNSFIIVILFTYHVIYPLKMYSSVVFSIFTDMCSHSQYQSIFITSKRKAQVRVRVVFVSFHRGYCGQGQNVQKVMVQPVNLTFRYLQNRSQIQVWLYEQVNVWIAGCIVGFDEPVHLVLNDVEEIHSKTKEATGSDNAKRR